MLQRVGQVRAVEPAAERSLSTGRPESDVVFMSPEAHFVARLDAELVAQFFGDHDLSLGPNAVSHTIKYNPRCAPAAPAPYCRHDATVPSTGSLRTLAEVATSDLA